MKVEQYFKNISTLTKTSILLGMSNLLLAGSVLGFTLYYSSRDIVTRIIPAGMTTEAEISSKSANADYKRAIALFIVTMTNNLSPRTAVGILDQMEPYFMPNIYKDYRSYALSIIEDPYLKNANVVSAFYPDAVQYEKETDRVFVIGTRVLKGDAVDKSTKITFELSVGIFNGRPIVTYIKSYPGGQGKTLGTMLNQAGGKYENLPEEAKPLDMRTATPDDIAKDVVEKRGDIDVQPQEPIITKFE